MNKCDISDTKTIIEHLNNNFVIAIPTDTIYGVATNLISFQKLIEIKKRDNKPLAILCSSLEEMQTIIKIEPKYLKVLEKHIPGALTVVGKTIDQKYKINPGIETTGVRIPNHASLLKLLELSGPLVVSSANISGEIETYSVDEVFQQFNNNIDLYVENNQSMTGEASVVIDIEKLVIYRDGKNAKEIIEQLSQVT